jgi:hypothetical protein
VCPQGTIPLINSAAEMLPCNVQARDDAFVSFSDGKAMFSELLYLSEGIADVRLDNCDSDSDCSESGGIQAVYGAMRGAMERAFSSYSDMLTCTSPPSRPPKVSKRLSETDEVTVRDKTRRKRAGALMRKQQVKAAACAARSAELVEIVGGHCTGFLRCNSLLPDAILKSLERLRAKTASVA